MTSLTPDLIQSRRSNQTVRAMPLAQAKIGNVLRVVALRGGGKEIEELAAAGFTPGRLCVVLSLLPGGATLIGLDERRLAIGSNVAAEIWVRLVAG
ncbi:FeoA family protein [Magnetospirillum molischianum]|uniref:Ferrous iron transporter FeoA-like domain-containing protein n=1 Tax=Magnetospirillum molischianum DSM 120 TaxID=1150626 RepID=H8FVK4_MAGML|nr:FeoA family protein [Magnetospirillum molischianum]CCG42392.1 hypothetical protein PHAMO_380060 [Magnetospirillum molischianum DSM 120]